MKDARDTDDVAQGHAVHNVALPMHVLPPSSKHKWAALPGDADAALAPKETGRGKRAAHTSSGGGRATVARPPKCLRRPKQRVCRGAIVGTPAAW